MKVMVVGGTRPDFINLSVLLEELKKQRVKTVFVNTGQHYSVNLSGIFFTELGLRVPDYNLNMPKGLGQGKQTGFVMSEIEAVLLKEKPDIVLSFSDANPATFAIVAAKMGFKVAHLEAGMRSNDRRMPEEINRRAIDAISDLYFCPTIKAGYNLVAENVNEKKITVSGKLIVDVLKKHEKSFDVIKDELLEERGSYIFSTIHRPENTENKSNLKNIIKGIDLVAKKYNKKIMACLHPRTINAMKRYKLKFKQKAEVFSPIGMFEFVSLEKNAFCYIGDSGTCQEETTIFGVPCVITRPSTERWETVDCGTSVIAGNKDGTMDAKKILKKTAEAILKSKKGNWYNPYKAGAAKRIVSVLKKKEKWIKNKKVMWND